ncbi:MAG: hypothetical protein IKG21_08555 [Atopobiaceae bacterium]|nr:hypothetical protein [Atopobiaceae bacterium]
MASRRGKALIAMLVAAMLAIGQVPAPAWGQVLEDAQLEDVRGSVEGLDEGVAGSGESASAEKLAMLWDGLSAVEVVNEEASGTLEEEAQRALAGEPSTARGIARAFADEARRMGLTCEESIDEDGRPVVIVTLDGIVWELDVAAGEPGNRPWEVEATNEDVDPPEPGEHDATDEVDEGGDEGVAKDELDAGESERAITDGTDEVGETAEAEAQETAEAREEEGEATEKAEQEARANEKAQEKALEKEAPALTVSKNASAGLSFESEVDDGAVTAQGAPKAARAKESSVTYMVHVQSYGNQSWRADGKTAGTSGESKRLEAIRIKVKCGTGVTGGITYRTHVQSVGWQQWRSDGAMSGTSGKAKRLEAIQIKLTGAIATKYDVYYRVHAQTYGWMGWTKNGVTAGTAGEAKRLEGIQVRLVAKGGAAPSNAGENTSAAFRGTQQIRVAAHVQGIGWQPAVGNGGTAGTFGQSRRVEALRFSLDGSRVPGGVEAEAHVQGIGWQGWRTSLVGTSGESRRLEAFSMRLTGEAADAYDVYYRAHVQSIGWLGWASNGERAGTEGIAKRMEAVQVRLVRKGAAAPDSSGSSMTAAFVGATSLVFEATNGTSWQGAAGDGFAGNVGAAPLRRFRAQLGVSVLAEAARGGVSYRAHTQDGSWGPWCANGEAAGNKGQAINAFCIKLTGKLAKAFDVYYCAHIASKAWLGWAKNGANAGSTVEGDAIDAVCVRLLAKGTPCPANIEDTYRYRKSYYEVDPPSNVRVEDFLSYAVSIAEDDSHGFNTFDHVRWGPDYDCSSFVITCLRHVGFNTGQANRTFTMYQELTKCGLIGLPFSHAALRRGDIMLVPEHHAEIYMGNGMSVGAHCSERGGAWGDIGDQTGREICVGPYRDFYAGVGWTYILRMP